ncbi:MAG: sigma-54 dependent transcriptional regulator [Candidatus Omnitrophota bacterium]|jgi:DNA-binding NtrC family response regulator
MENKEIALIVDDDEGSAKLLKKIIEPMLEEEVICASNGTEAKEIINKKKLILAVLDYQLPDTTGVELLKLIKSIDADIPVVIVTGFGTIESGIEAIKEGAFDYILKPFQTEKIHAMVRGLTNLRLLKEENIALREELGLRYSMDRLIGKSDKIRKIYDLLPDLMNTDSTVLIQGESGTGKELLARAIHYNSPRKEKPFVIADCTALAENLLESELFGHEKGSFTGAIKRKIGRFEQADGGTIFLDEIGDISPVAQLKLLRVLQEKKFERVGGEETVEVDVRVIAATNKDLDKLMEEGKFREDLYYRLNVISVYMPPLRERKEDIPVLAKEFMQQFSKKNDKWIKKISDEAYRSLTDYDWPGNIRELENAIERAVVIAKGNIIRKEDLPHKVQGSIESFAAESNSLRENEKSLIARVLKECDNNINKAAKELEISRSTLYGKMEKFGLR